MDDPYEILGVAKTASGDEIRAAYRALAKKYHPDLNPGKKAAEDKFKAITGAYDLLSDKDKRARFDRGEIDASGAEKPQARRFYRDFGDDTGRQKYRPNFEGGFDADDLSGIFEEVLRQSGGMGGAREFAVRGADARYHLDVDFLEAAKGGVKRLTLPDGNTLDVTIPLGLRDGQTLRLKGKGMPGMGANASPGDALIEVGVRPHPFFRREGNDIIIELPVTLKEAVLGAKVDAPTLEGPVALTIPPHSTTGMRLRLKGRGIAGGHQVVELKVVLPRMEEPELETFLKTWTPQHDFNPRKDMVSP